VNCLKQLVSWLEQAGMDNICIIDNDSAYPPVLEYYQSIRHRVVYLGRNLGFTALWDSEIYNEFRSSYYIYTDPDVVPVATCPHDFIEHLFQILKKYPDIEKVGMGLKIDDLPDHYDHKHEVITSESKFWEKKIENDLFDAEVDTTLALYRPLAKGPSWACKAYRTGGNYLLHHLPWYEDSENLDDETLYYVKNIKKFTSRWSEKKYHHELY
jgi:hypothetical protein